MKVQSFAVNGNTIFAGAYGVFLSTDNGASWAPRSSGLNLIPGSFVWSLASYSSRTFAGISAIFVSTDNGGTWLPANNGIPQVDIISSIVIDGNFVFAGTDTYTGGNGIFRSSDNGLSWSSVTSGLPSNTNISTIAVSGSNIFIGTYVSGIYLSGNNGNSWTAINNGIPAGIKVNSIATTVNKIFAGLDNGGIYLSTNNGSSWTNINNGLTASHIYSLAISGNNILAGTLGKGICISSNSGTSWLGINSGLNPDSVYNEIHVITFNSSYAFCAPEYFNNGHGVYRRPLTELTGISRKDLNIPKIFSLSQNYPNPFNPSTIINYQLPKSSEVKLIIYDAIGREVNTLVDENQNAGSYQVEFDGSNFPSGVYFYKLQAGDYIQTKKMGLIK